MADDVHQQLLAVVQCLFIAYPARVDRLKSEFMRRHALLIVALVERWVIFAVVLTLATLSPRADSYGWVMMWRKLVVLGASNLALGLVSCLLSISAQRSAVIAPLPSAWNKTMAVSRRLSALHPAVM